MHKTQQKQLSISTSGRGMTEITREVQGFVHSAEIKTGLCNLFIQHTSASLFICENADPDVLHDLEDYMTRLVKDGDHHFRHTLEGKDDMAAHIRTVLTETSLTIPIENGQIALGTWQGVFLWEHRYASHVRKIVMTAQGE